MITALITGITGQDGSYLAELLLGKGYRVVGIRREGTATSLARIAHVADRIELRTADLLDERSLTHVVEDVKPDEVYNLAAQSFVQSSWSDPVLTGEMTAVGVARLLQAVRNAAPRSRFFQAGTSEMFGSAVETPQRESTPFRPRSPYGTAKVYAHWITANYRETLGIHASSGILFNHESPRRGLEFVTRKVTNAAARIKLGLAGELRLGTLESRRDWGFAGDYVEAMWRMLQADVPRDFVIGTGESHSVAELCEIAFARVGLDYRDHISIDPSFARGPEQTLLVADASEAREHLGWSPTMSFRRLVESMVDADLARHATESGAGSASEGTTDRVVVEPQALQPRG